jgi:hypothetical protein
MRRIAIVGAIVLGCPLAARAHHEAIFGPLSATMVSADRYVTAQLFTRRAGPDDDREQETTTVLSAGFSPFEKPLSFAVILPVSIVSHGGTRTGLENVVIGARYRIDFPGALSGDNFVMALGGIELPTGTIDHRFGRGAPAGIAGGLISTERRPFSMIGYTFRREPGTYGTIRESGNLFVGAGLAWTPIDDPAGRLVSFQIGLSHETQFREREDDVPVAESGKSGVFAHPTLLYGISQRMMMFGTLTVPVRQQWRSPEDREAFRVGAGVILAY